MKPNTLLISLCCLLVTFSSCDTSEDQAISSIPKIKTITYHNGSTTTTQTYEYDQQGRVTKISQSNENYTQYEYQPGKIIEKETRNNYSFHNDTLLLNDQGLVITNIISRNIYTNCEYTQEGHLDKSSSYFQRSSPDLIADNTWADGNRTLCEVWEQDKQEPVKDEELELLTSYKYHYLTDHLNTISYENMGMAFYGKQNKYLEAMYILTNLKSGINYEYTLHYQWDARGRVIKKYFDYYPELTYNEYTYYN